MKNPSKVAILLVALVVLTLCSCQNKNAVTDVNSVKSVYSVDPDLIAFADAMHTDCVSRFLQDPFVVKLVDEKRIRHEEFFTDKELNEMNRIYADLFAGYESNPEYIACFQGDRDKINELSFTLEGDKYNFKPDIERVVKSYAEVSRNTQDPELNSFFIENDKCMETYINNIATLGYQDAYTKYMEDTDKLASCAYSSKENAEVAATLIGIGRSTARLMPDYATGFGTYPDDPLTYPELGLAGSADLSWFSYSTPGACLPWPFNIVVVGGGFVCSGTIVVMNRIHHTHY